MDFLKQVSIEIYPEGASDEERKSYSKKYGAQMHACWMRFADRDRKENFPNKETGREKSASKRKASGIA
jgi:hypothetical protein